MLNTWPIYKGGMTPYKKKLNRNNAGQFLGQK